MSFISVILIVLIVVSYFVLNYRRQLPIIKAARRLPGPKPLPLIGNACYLLKKDFDEFLNSMLSLMDGYSSPARFWFGNKLYIVVYEPEQIKIVLQSSSCLDKGEVYKYAESWLGTGLLTAPASIWKHTRKMIAPCFNASLLKVFFDIFAKQSLTLVHELEKLESYEKEVDLFHYIWLCTLDMIYESTTGMKLEAQSNRDNRYVKAITRIKEIVAIRMRNIFLLPNTLFNLTHLSCEQLKNLALIHSYADKIIKRASNKLNYTSKTESTTKTFLDILMKTSYEGETLTKKNIRDEVNTILVTGSDTTAVTMNFTIFILANFPEIQEKVYKELSEIYGNENLNSAPIKYEDLQHMDYLSRVIKETMRLFPLVACVTRHLKEDLKIGEFILPKGADIFLPFIKIHRNETYWQNPLVFDPDRFLPHNMANRHQYSYLPFSNGPRNCIGWKYGMVSMKVMLATLIRTFVFKVDKRITLDEIKLNVAPLLTVINPLKVKIKKRNV
ncbi:cytochrome P450 4C1-like [Formica exsecta]|uniref:cytochrome P450 4C1-like n=1 Tax=Formica exsecta TaxID=72781 RepID=UPI001143C3EF|nr:cytochrome P450 4C1-like [Formica exsecta]